MMKNKFIPYIAFQVLNYIILTLVAVVATAPFLMVISTSINSEKDIAANGYALFTRQFSFDAYKTIFSGNSQIFSAYYVTVFITIVGTLLSLLVTSMLAYGLSKKGLPFRKSLTFIVFFTMLFSGGIIPWYLVVTGIGLKNSIWSMILPCLVNAWYMFILRNFFESIPDSLKEAAWIDGANEITVFIRIILPLSIPGLAVIGLFCALDYWNQWYNALMFIRDKNKFPLQMLLREVLSRADSMMNSKTISASVNMPTESMKMATVVLTTGPIILLYPFLQRYFVKGIMVGSIKG